MENRAIEGASVPHGQKRHAEDKLEDEQRFAKRFNLLNLGMVSQSKLVSLKANSSLQNILASSTSQWSSLRQGVNHAPMALRILCS